MPFSKKLTHVAEAVANLISQFEGKQRIETLVSIFVGQIQELEDAFSDILTETTIDNSVGVNLDNIGLIVGEPRAGRNDTQYRIAIKARIGLNTSGGTIENIISIVISVANAVVTVEIIEYFPASFTARIIEPIDPAVTDTDRIAEFIKGGRPAGVNGHLEFAVAGAFQFDGPAGSGFDEGKYGGGAAA